MHLAAFTVLILASLAALGRAVPVSYVKTDNGWSKISSREAVQWIMKAVAWTPESATWAESPEAGDGGYGEPVDSESDDDYEYEAAEAEWNGSGDDKPDRDKDGACIHRGTLHSIQRGSIEVNQAQCLLCACRPTGQLHCLKTC